MKDQLLDNIAAEYSERLKDSSGRIGLYRSQIAPHLTKYMVDHLKIDQKKVLPIIEKFVKPETLVLEMAHTSQIFNLGRYRILAKAINDGIRLREDGDRDVVILISLNDHLVPNDTKESFQIKYYFEGKIPNKILTTGISKKERNVPMIYLNTPSQTHIEKVKDQIISQIKKNVIYSIGLGYQIINQEKIRSNIEYWMDSLSVVAREVSSYSEWLNKMLYLQLERSCVDIPIIISPTSWYRFFFPGLIKKSWEGRKELNNLINKASETVVDNKRVSSNYVSGWIYCKSCNMKTKRPIIVERSSDLIIQSHCDRCDRDQEYTIDDKEIFFVPDVVLRQSIISSVGVSARFVGDTDKEYFRKSDLVTKDFFGFDAPERILVRGIPKFYGIGEPYEGCGRASVLRALFEVDARALLTRLMESPHVGDVEIYSEYLKKNVYDN